MRCCGAERNLHLQEPAWPSEWLPMLRSKPQFFVGAPEYTNEALTEFVRERIATSLSF